MEIVAQYPEWLQYDFPGKVAKKMYPYDGQKQIYFLVRLKAKAKIDLNGEHQEFIDHTFVKVESVLDTITQFKKPVYKKVLSYFKQEGYL